MCYPRKREKKYLEQGIFDPLCAVCNGVLLPVETPEDAPYHCLSFYGLTKQVQEQMLLMSGPSTGFRSFVLRLQNVYGPGQSLANPYTGILAIFSNRARENKPIFIFEDGQESRDFVFVDDVVDAFAACLRADLGADAILNVGSGLRTTVHEVASRVLEHFGSRSKMEVDGSFRDGDIRHNFADLSKVRQALDFEPSVPLEVGLARFLEWAQDQKQRQFAYESSLEEMRQRGLLHG
jgi:dTDP-L-rhamnose 4-epimerase